MVGRRAFILPQPQGRIRETEREAGFARIQRRFEEHPLGTASTPRRSSIRPCGSRGRTGPLWKGRRRSTNALRSPAFPTGLLGLLRQRTRRQTEVMRRPAPRYGSRRKRPVQKAGSPSLFIVQHIPEVSGAPRPTRAPEAPGVKRSASFSSRSASSPWASRCAV